MTYYLVDTENVARRWTQYTEKAEAGDIFLMFYSKNVGAVSMGLFGPAYMRGVQFGFIECHVGPSSMDFQMATELGRLIALHPDAEFSIISKDTGFDPVVMYWRDRGIRISREEPEIIPAKAAAAAALAPAPEPIAPPDPTAVPEPTVAKEYKTRLGALGLTESDLCVATGILMAAMRQPEKNRRTDAYNRFLKRYGAQDGLSRYRVVKDLVADIAVHGPFPQARTDNQTEDGTAELPRTLNEAVSVLDIEFSSKQLEKLSNMFQHASRMSNKKGIYRKQLSESFGVSQGTEIFKATEFLL